MIILKNGLTSYCSHKCACDSNRVQKILVFCKLCNKEIGYRVPSRLHKNSFCCLSHNTTYNNMYIKKGIQRSKAEIWIQEQLSILYPNLQIHYNQRDTINAELDIYIPSLKLAFELNGPFHYEPIYGTDKLLSTQNNDKRKFAACHENKISLCVIDISKESNFKPIRFQKYLDIIIQIINENLRNRDITTTTS